MIRLITTTTLLFIAIIATGQKTRLLAELIGADTAYIAPRGAIVKYMFSEVAIKRNADGEKTLVHLLRSAALFNDDPNAGALEAVHIVQGKTVTVLPRMNRERKEQMARPNAAVNIAPTAPARSWNVPDSMTVVNGLEDAKQSVEWWKMKMWKNTRPVWAFVMWIFNSLVIFLICLGGLFRYVAKTAAGESAVNVFGIPVIGTWILRIQQNAAAMMLVITWMVAVVLLIDMFMWMVYLEIPLWTILVIWFPVLWIAEKFTNWIVPNVQVVGGSSLPRR